MTTMRRTRPKPPPIYIERSPFGSIEDPWTVPASCWNDVINGAQHKLAILRAYLYRQRRGIRGAEGARVGKPEKTSHSRGDKRGRRCPGRCMTYWACSST